MAAKAQNEFYSGVDTDSDNLRVKNTMLRSALNIRLINKDGQGFVVTSVGGSELAFSLSSGFVPLGKCEYNGIAYILSVNPTTTAGEIGCYPATNDNCAGGFQHAYKPLKNYTGAVDPLITPNPTRLDFTTTAFNFDCNHQIECFARTDYDDSVNIYIADWKNPFRVINSGFNQQGVCTDRYYWTGSFPNGVDAFGETGNHIQVALSSITTGGALKGGNWIFFFRYTTIDFNPTSFMGESNACQVTSDDSIDGITLDGSAGGVNTDKKVILNLSNLDTNYPYIEVGFFYYSDGAFTTGLIDELYQLNGSSTLQITIKGTENTISMIAADLIKRKPKDDVPKTIVQMENRAWLGNLKERTGFNQDFVDIAKCITADYDDSLTIDEKPFAAGQDPEGATAEGQYKDYRKTYNETGYFRGETYAFGIVWVFKDGRESDAFPVLGVDDWDPTAPVNSNTNGVYRFPNTEKSNFRAGGSSGTLSVMGVTFNTAGCVLTQYMIDNIEGFYFVRAERIPNLKYQGIIFDCFQGPGVQLDCIGGITCGVGGDPILVESTNIIPLTTKRHWPSVWRDYSGMGTPADYITTENSAGFDPYRDAQLIPANYGFYSSDLFFKKVFTSGTSIYVQEVANASLTVSDYGANAPQLYCPSKFLECVSLSFLPVNVASADGYNIAPWSQANQGTFNFTSAYPEGQEAEGNSFYYSSKKCNLLLCYKESMRNRAFATCNYIGVENCTINLAASYVDAVTDPATPTYGGPNIYKIVNLYTFNPITVDITTVYNTSGLQYFKISNFIKLSDWANVPNMVFYRGDCFLQRTYLKQLYNPDYYPITQTDDSGLLKYYTFGIVFSVVTENAYNSAMRMDDAINTYYPETGLAAPNDFLSNDIKFESTLFNEGYNKVLSDKAFFGYDPLVPYRGAVYPTRIRYTETFVPGSFTDGYRQSGIAYFQDYDYRLGQINKLVDFSAKLVSVQENGISFHYINERKLAESSPSAGEIVLGEGLILAKQTQNIADGIGTQHQWSIVKTDSGVYGIDYNKRKIWRLSGEGFELISDTKLFRTRLFEIIEDGISLGDHTDILHNLPDNPICDKGIVGTYDKKYRDVIWSFIFNSETKANRSIKFSEWMNAFMDEYSNATPFYVNINENLFSLNPGATREFWLEDVPVTTGGADNRLTFWGTQYKMKLSFVVNQYPDMAKVFDNISLNAGPITPDGISYETINQLGTQSPFVDPLEPFVNPVYLENIWNIPIRRADAVQGSVNNIYSVKSRMRGTWLKVTLEYLSKTDIFAKSSTTDIRKSI